MLSRSEALVLSILRRGPVSGESLAAELGVTRAYVHKVVDELRRWGVPVAAVPGSGYRMLLEDDLSRTGELLTLTGVGAPVVYFERCSRSSQDIARDIAASGATSWTTVVCEEMASGRGRMGRAWYAPKGGLWFTTILRPGFTGPLHLLSLAAGVSVAETLRALLDIDARVKWPNDVLVGERKVCGVLVEGEAEADRVRVLYLGVGVNANNEIPEEVRGTAASLRELAGASVPRATLLAVVLSRLRTYYGHLSSGKPERVIESWTKLSGTIGRMVRVVTRDGREIVGRAVALDRLGRLTVEVSGVRHHIEAGDVHHLEH